jgi:hypothetical protein
MISLLRKQKKATPSAPKSGWQVEVPAAYERKEVFLLIRRLLIKISLTTAKTNHLHCRGSALDRVLRPSGDRIIQPGTQAGYCPRTHHPQTLPIVLQRPLCEDFVRGCGAKIIYRIYDKRISLHFNGIQLIGKLCLLY